MHHNPVILTRLQHQQQTQQQQQQQTQQQQQYTKQAQSIRDKAGTNSANDKAATTASRSNAPDDLPYSQWTKITADNGLVYLAHPRTGESKWLWSRHWDPASGKDYLVNTISGERSWVTKSNQHLCPLKATVPSNVQSASSSTAADRTSSARTSTVPALGQHGKPAPIVNNATIPVNPFGVTPSNANVQAQAQAQRGPKSNASVNAASQSYGAGKVPIEKTGSSVTKDQSVYSPEAVYTRSRLPNPSSATTVSPSANLPKDIALAPGEVLMTAPATGQPYALNTQTNTRRWLSAHPGPANPQNASNTTPLSQIPNNNISKPDVHPNIHQNAHANPGLFFREVPHRSGGSAGSAQQRQNPGMTYPTGAQRMPASSGQGVQHSTPSRNPPVGELRNGTEGQQRANSGNTTQMTPTAIASGAESEQQAVNAKVSALEKVLDDVARITSGGKYDVSKLEQATNARLASHNHSRNDKTTNAATLTDPDNDVDQRLLQLAELLTQNMLKVDAVDSDGSAIVRAKRKLVVNRLLTLADRVEALRNTLKELN